MKVDAPDDLGGRLLACQYRINLVADTLVAFMSAEEREPSKDSIRALGYVCDEITEELAQIYDLYVAEANDIERTIEQLRLLKQIKKMQATSPSS